MTSGLWARRASRLLHPAIIYFIICNYWKSNSNGQRWIRTTEAICSRFTVCPLWPLGNPSIFFLFDGTNRARTYDPLLVRQMLSQLSYDPIQTTQKRLELSTSAVTGRRSNQLSHWAIFCCTYVPSKLHTRNIFFHPTYHLAWSCPRPISISQLHTLLYFHLWPIYLVVFKGSYYLRRDISSWGGLHA